MFYFYFQQGKNGTTAFSFASDAILNNVTLRSTVSDGDGDGIFIGGDFALISSWRQLVSDLWLQDLQPVVASQTPALQLASQLMPEGAALL